MHSLKSYLRSKTAYGDIVVIPPKVCRCSPNGVWTKNGVAKLRKLDSLMKESQRMNLLGLLTFERRVTNNLTLPDGVVLPKEYNIGCPTGSIAKDVTLWEKPFEFDGF